MLTKERLALMHRDYSADSMNYQPSKQEFTELCDLALIALDSQGTAETESTTKSDHCSRCDRKGFELFRVLYRSGYPDNTDSHPEKYVCRDCRCQMLSVIEKVFSSCEFCLDSQGSGWRPIADAPKNMAVVWLAFGNATKPWVAKGRKNGVGDWLDADTLEKFKYDSTPTHFMPCQPKPIPPLPSPPKEPK